MYVLFSIVIDSFCDNWWLIQTHRGWREVVSTVPADEGACLRRCVSDFDVVIDTVVWILHVERRKAQLSGEGEKMEPIM